MMKTILWGLGVIGTVDAALVFGKKVGIIPDKQKIDEVIIRREKERGEISNSNIKDIKEEEPQGWIDYLLWGDRRRYTESQTSTAQSTQKTEDSSNWLFDLFFEKPIEKKEMVKESVKQSTPSLHNNEILINSGKKVTAFWDYFVDGFLTIVAPYWEYFEILIAFNLAIIILSVIALDVYILLKFLLFVKKILGLIKKLFSPNDDA